MTRRSLPLLQDAPALERRQMLALFGAVAAAGCGADVTGGGGGSDASTTDVSAPTDAVDDATPVDAPAPEDTATMPDVSSCTPTGSMVGTLASIAVGTWQRIASPRVIVGRDAGGLFAYSSVCTHQGCVINAPDASGNCACRCHGATFDGNGAVTRGPARTALQHYAVIVCDSRVFVDTAMRVDAAARTAAG
jgi:Rieske Fe-S protein